MNTLIPPIKWAQDQIRIFITICLSEILDEIIEIDETFINIRLKSGGNLYEYKLELFDQISPKDNITRINKTVGGISLVLRKSNTLNWWTRLTKGSFKNPNISIDWDKWVENEFEDDVTPDGEVDLNNLPDSEFTSSGDMKEEEDSKAVSVN